MTTVYDEARMLEEKAALLRRQIRHCEHNFSFSSKTTIPVQTTVRDAWSGDVVDGKSVYGVQQFRICKKCGLRQVSVQTLPTEAQAWNEY